MSEIVMKNYKFAVLDPRNLPSAQAANDAIFASGPVLGIEVTVPALAARCSLGNIDPQHTGGNAGRSAIEVVIGIEMPAEWTTLATVRPDLDSVGAMSVIGIRHHLLESSGGCCDMPTFFCQEQVKMVAKADKFAWGGYPGPRPLPTADNPWPEESASAESSRPLAAINAAVADFKVPFAERVATMEKWLLTGEEPARYREQVEKERDEMVGALESGAIKHLTTADDKIAVVESTHRAATMVGYSLAPVVVALNPSFKLGVGEPHRKFTVCAFEAARFADIKAALAELAGLEPGWGGSPTIGGSPQGVSSTLTVEQVVEVVARHLK